MKNIKKRIQANVLVLTGLILSFTVLIILIAGIVIQKTWKKMTLNDICPDYFSENYAYIVDKDGRGIDSVSVTMKDNSNFNVIYKTFTDVSGKFTLFNDFGSFALHSVPFSYELQVSYQGFNDTIIYKFKKYRMCHFKKVEGPDTIVFDPPQKNWNRLTTEYKRKVLVDDIFEYAPYEKITISEKTPSGLTGQLEGWSNIKYGSINIGRYKLLLAVADSPLKVDKNRSSGMEGACLIIDKNNNGDLRDDPVNAWNLFYSDGFNESADCDLRKCFYRDTVILKNDSIIIDLQLTGIKKNSTCILYRRADVLGSVIELNGKRYRIALWDRVFTMYKDLKNVQIGIDYNNDSKFSSSAGNSELIENALSGLTLDSIIYEIDSITSDGSEMFYRRSEKDVNFLTDASSGVWTPDFSAFCIQPISLYNEIANYKMVVLCFFEGNAKNYFEVVETGSFIAVLKQKVNNLQIIGINRKSDGKHNSVIPVIEENKGWKGPIVRQFHNHLDNEIICIDSTATIVCRGKPGRELLEVLCVKTCRKDKAEVLYLFDQAIDNALIAGTTNSK